MYDGMKTTGCHTIQLTEASLALSCADLDCPDAFTQVDMVRFQELGLSRTGGFSSSWGCYRQDFARMLQGMVGAGWGGGEAGEDGCRGPGGSPCNSGFLVSPQVYGF